VKSHLRCAYSLPPSKIDAAERFATRSAPRGVDLLVWWNSRSALDAKAVDVAAWLGDVGLERYEQAFLEHDIRADVLPDLTEADLEKLGVSLGDRKRFLKAIAALQVASSTESPRSDQVQGTDLRAFAA
jgi:hypothetical protein